MTAGGRVQQVRPGFELQSVSLGRGRDDGCGALHIYHRLTHVLLHHTQWTKNDSSA